MIKIACLLSLHTGLIDSKYKYVKHKDSEKFDSIIATFDKKCRKCDKELGQQDFAFMYTEEGYLRYLGNKSEVIEKAKNFTDNRVKRR